MQGVTSDLQDIQSFRRQKKSIKQSSKGLNRSLRLESTFNDMWNKMETITSTVIEYSAQTAQTATILLPLKVLVCALSGPFTTKSRSCNTPVMFGGCHRGSYTYFCI